jgi:tetratricopeptide (TPR) repeat protein
MKMRFSRSAGHAAQLAAAFILMMAPSAGAATGEAVGTGSLAGTYLAARTADVEKDLPNAAAFYRSALAADPENLLLLERSLVLTAAAGEIRSAVDLAEQLFDKAPTSEWARLVLAVDHIAGKRYAEAIATLGEPGPSVLGKLSWALLVAWARVGEGEIDAAVAELDAFEAEELFEPLRMLHAGYILLAAGRAEQAVETLAEARALEPNDARVSEAYARALAVAGRTEEAVATLEEVIALFPDNALATTALADIRAGRAVDGAVGTPTAGAAEALSGIGAAMGQEGGVEAAFLYLRLALHLDPQTAGGLAALSLGNLLAANGQGEAAIIAFETIAPDAPFRSLGVLRAARALDRMDRTEEAEAAFEEAIARDPDDVQRYISYGDMLRGRDRFAEAAAMYSQAIDRLGTPVAADWSLYYFRGISYERVGEWEKAEADFREALELEPDQPDVLNYLGYSWIDMGMNLDEAMAMIRKAVEERPNDGYIVDSLGWAHYRLGQYEEAVVELERAVALRPNDPVINDHLGDAYWKMGRFLEAQFQWRHARDFGAEGEELELILRKIAEGRLIEDEPELEKDASLYIVKPGDTLWRISAALFDSPAGYTRLLDANRDRLESPDQIYPGMQLLIPGDI